MELQLCLALPTNPSKPLHHKPHNKRSFSQLYEDDRAHTTNNATHPVLPTLSLLPLTPSHPITKNGNDGDHDVEALVGWPPLNSWRKKLHYENYGGDDDQMLWIHHQHAHGSVGLRVRGSNTLYVKVKMEGVGIARKVDLAMHHSFHTLKQTLLHMFGKCPQHSNSYKLTYQDQEGDWLLADDVPWRSFIQCVQRLKLVKNSG